VRFGSFTSIGEPTCLSKAGSRVGWGTRGTYGAVPPCSTLGYIETTNIGGLAAVCDVTADCFGNVTTLMPSAHAENEGWFMADRWPDATGQFKYGFVRAAADMSLQTKVAPGSTWRP
jgi:hypothetical protein